MHGEFHVPRTVVEKAIRDYEDDFGHEHLDLTGWTGEQISDYLDYFHDASMPHGERGIEL